MLRVYKLIADPRKKGNLKKIIRYVYCISDNPQENDLKLFKELEDFTKQYNYDEYIIRCWESEIEQD